jgi:long-chain fatty acid transport protein
MAKRFNFRQLFLLMSAAGTFGLSNAASAASFSLWEQDAASIGNYHAGASSEANDASTAWYNPAGLVRIKNQQVILGADPIVTDFRFNGRVGVNTVPDLTTGLPAITPATAQGGSFNIVPFGHYAAPISDRFVFGLSVDVPFGLETDYPNTSFTRYSSTLTKLQVFDITPSLGVKITDQLSMGVGVDFQRLSAEFNQVTTALNPETGVLLDTGSHSAAYDWGIGWRIGGLYQFTPKTRLGLNYRSQVVHHPEGNSKFVGPLATDLRQYSPNFHSKATLPAITTLSVFHTFNPCWDIMSSVTYTQWSVFNNLVLQNIAGIDESFVNSNTVVVTIPNRYKNVWNFAVGGNFHPTERWTIRTGVGYDQTPSVKQYRNLQIPDSDRIALALGARFQATKTIGIDAGWTHVFAMNTRIDTTQAFGPEIVTTQGSMSGNADVYGLQVKWDIV